jgi:dTDP-4-dehydrorhamnose 3,5-epimerase
MIFHPLKLEGAYLVELERIHDDRGFNARAWCEREFAAQGLSAPPRQTNIIANRAKGTLRGMHWQDPPRAESKLFRVTRGAIFDVIVDLRPASPTYGEWLGVELSAGAYTMLYVPEQFGQGFQTLTDDTELTYQVTEFYSPDHGRGFRWDDPAFGISWPLEVSVISEKDRGWPNFPVGDAVGTNQVSPQNGAGRNEGTR